MIRHLTPADYRVQRWANGRGETVEIARADGPDGLLWRLSIAQVVEDGPFSRFPGIARSLTVIDGPGFAIRGPGIDLRADPLVPVSFPGDAEVGAAGVAGISRDFNVMTAASLPVPLVRVGCGALPQGRVCAVHALGPCELAAGPGLDPGDTWLSDEAVGVRSGQALIVVLEGVRG